MFTKSLYVQVLDSRSHLKASLHKQITEDSQVFRLVVNNEDVASGSFRRIHEWEATTVRLIIEWIQLVTLNARLQTPARFAHGLAINDRTGWGGGKSEAKSQGCSYK